MLNHCVLMGRLTRDPELQPMRDNNSMLRFSLAVDRDFVDQTSGERGTDFIDFVAFRGPAEFIAKYFAKGDLMAVVGRLTVRNWTDRDGNRRRSTEVKVEQAYFGGTKRKEAQAAPEAPPPEDELPPVEDVEAVFTKNDLYLRAVDIALELGRVTTSVLQRRMRISFVAASELISQMEMDGIVEASASGPARVVVTREQWQARQGGQQGMGQDGMLDMTADDMDAIFGPPGGAEGDAR